MEKKCKIKLIKPKHPLSYYNKKQLEKGTKIEYEHTRNKAIARNIAINHLDEFPDYYKALEKMEKRLKRKKKRKR